VRLSWPAQLTNWICYVTHWAIHSSTKFAAAGYVALLFTETGPVQLFSTVPITSLDVLHKTKLGQRNDDPVEAALLQGLGVHGTALSIPDMLPSMTTGKIDAVFVSPILALGLQWNSKLKHVSSVALHSGSLAGLVLVKRQFDQLSAADQKVLTEVFTVTENKLHPSIPGTHAAAMTKMVGMGLSVDATPAAVAAELHARHEAAVDAQLKSVAPDFLQAVRKALKR